MNESCNLLDIIDNCLDQFFQEHKGEEPESGLCARIVDEVEKKVISRTLKYCDSNQSKAAKILGINRNTLRKKINDYKINVK